MRALKYLNLSFNQLEGHIPKGGVFKNIRSEDLLGNPSLCGTRFLSACNIKRNQTSSHSFSKKTWIILAALGSVFCLILLVLGILLFHRYMKKKKKVNDTEDTNPKYTSALSLQRFHQKDLEHATNNFSPENIIGASSLSTVHKGTLEDGKNVAVKKLNHQFPAESGKCFDREVKTLSKLRHRNLVKVLGYAWESKKLKALVLEHMENGNLDNITYGQMADDWTLSNRIDILVSVASGLSIPAFRL